MQISSDKPVYLDRQGAVATLVLNKPKKRNALDYSMWRQMAPLVQRAILDPQIHVIVVRGVDETAFAAGADIDEFETMFATSEGCRAYHDAIREVEQLLGSASKPTIAMIHGPCIGGGMEIALACDVRFASADARLGVTASKLGIVYSLTSTRRLMQLVGASRTRDLLLSARLLDAAQALRIGLVDQVWEGSALQVNTADYVNTLLQRAPGAMAAGKHIIDLVLAGANDETPTSLTLRLNAFGGKELAEGIRAYKEKRLPRF